MPRIAYAQPGTLPSPFCPVPAYSGYGLGPWANGGNVDGQPGTMGVPSGTPDFPGGIRVNGAPVRGYGGGNAAGTGTMPPVWYPQLYWLTKLDGATLVSGNSQAMSVYSDNQMPVPAADPIGRAALLARPPVFTGSRTVSQPARVTSWPSWLSTASYGG